MTVEKLRRWLELLPPQERNQPCLSVDGVWLTPEDMLREAEAGSSLGRKAQMIWETKGLGTDEEMLKERIRRRLSRYPPDKPIFITLRGKLTPRQILEEIESGTRLGKNWIETERAYLKVIGKLKERV
ncbi:hypothetical protein J7J18_03830 [bacterium]|nr:hypothetical protein [bacterium]